MGLLRLQYDLYQHGPHPLSNGTGSQTPNALLLGAGTNADPVLNRNKTADKNFLDWRLKDESTSGTTRGLYLKLTLSGGAGGECGRFFTRVESNTPADTCNALHNSLEFGSSAGNITGLATVIRNTLHIPTARTIGGTIAPVMSEFYGDGATGAVNGAAAFFRACVDGHADLKGSVDDNANLFDIAGLTAGAAHLFRTGLTAATLNAACTCALRFRLGGTTYFFPVATAAAG